MPGLLLLLFFGFRMHDMYSMHGSDNLELGKVTFVLVFTFLYKLINSSSLKLVSLLFLLPTFTYISLLIFLLRHLPFLHLPPPSLPLLIPLLLSTH